jgi:hypothetical protein
MSLKIFESDKANKRFYATYKDKKVYFGQPGGTTFIDGASEQTKNAYWARHYANPIEKYRIDNIIFSPSLLSAYILWNTNDINKNIKLLNKQLQLISKKMEY